MRNVLNDLVFDPEPLELHEAGDNPVDEAVLEEAIQANRALIRRVEEEWRKKQQVQEDGS